MGVCLFILSGCQLGYLAKSSFYQLRMLSRKESFEKALVDPKISEETKRKIKLVIEAKKFGEEKMFLTHSKNYESFVLLDDKYVVYAITASYKDRLEPFTWTFPFVGRVPYKGFFKKTDADEEKAKLQKRNYDVAERGVSAYSTLGWFSDPLLSSMADGDDEDLIDTIIHETTHATVYIKSSADFNERLATFVGGKGMEEFYIEKEGKNSLKIEHAKLVSEDSKIFSQFISGQIKELEGFYRLNKTSADLMLSRELAFGAIKKNFDQSCRPRLKTDSFRYFSKITLNNAVLLNYKTYYQDLSIYQKALDKFQGNWKSFMDYFRSLKDSKDPASELARFVSTP